MASEIDKLQQVGSHVINGDLRFSAFGHSYRLLSFKPTVVGESLGWETVLLYRLGGARPRFVWKKETWNNDPQIIGQSPPPGDWNKDGHILLGVWSGWWTTGWYQGHLDIFELHPDETLEPVLRGIIPPGFAALSVMKRQDQSDLLLVGDYRDSPGIMGLDKWSLYTCCGPYLYRYFEWRNGHYQDVSAENRDRYYPAMGTALDYLTTAEIADVTMMVGGTTENVGPQLFSLNLLRLLVIYEDIGEREAGWKLVQSLVAEAKHSGRLRDGTYVDQIFMPVMQKLHSDDKPFVAPDYVLYHRAIGTDANGTPVYLYPDKVDISTVIPVSTPPAEPTTQVP
jgi:hypothetical protein